MTEYMFQGQTALVTGAGRGIGREIALALMAQGMHVVSVARTGDELAETIRLAEAGTGTAEVVDVRNRGEVDSVVSRTLAAHGRIDLLVNNAGSNLPIGPVWEVDPDLWQQDIDVNLVAPFNFARATLPSMIARGSGRIINVTGGGLRGPIPYDSGYASSKAAIGRFTETLAIEVKPFGIKVFGMGPDAVLTQLSRNIFESPEGQKWNRPLAEEMASRWRSPEETAKLAVFMASGAADALSGRLVGVRDDVPAIMSDIAQVLASDRYTLRLVT